MLATLGGASTFGVLDWAVVAGYLVVTTVIGAQLTGRQATIRDFFLGGRKLAWWAVCGSTIATEISTATFVVVPAMSFAAGGNLTYLQLAIGSIIARFIVAYWFVPRYYEHEIYSPYDYVGRRLGPRVKTVTTALFMMGAVLGQGGRLFTSALVLKVIADIDLVLAIWLMGGFGILWSMIGGITMVIWTDFIQFVILVLGALLALGFALYSVPAPLRETVQLASEAGKFQFFNFTTDWSIPYTFWGGLIATPFANLAAFGTDQVMAQRMFCCRNAGDAKKATIWSSLSLVVTVIMMMVGIALYAYFHYAPFSAAEIARYGSDLYGKDKEFVFPIFILRALPVGVRGLVVAAVFAAAVSTFESALAALSQTTLAPIKAIFAGRPRSLFSTIVDREVALSKSLVIAWGAILCLMAMACIPLKEVYANAIDLLLALAGYTYGPLLGVFLLAFLPTRRDDQGLGWAVTMSILAVFAVSSHAPGAREVVWSCAGLFALLAVVRLYQSPGRVVAVWITAALIIGLHALNVGYDAAGRPKYLAFTWPYPIGTVFTFVLGYVLGRERPASPANEKPAEREAQRAGEIRKNR